MGRGYQQIVGVLPLTDKGLPTRGAESDAFGRARTASPTTIFDSKQVFDNQPLFWDDQETSGSGTSSTYDQDRASSVLAVTATTAGTRIRQTFRRFNYQPGKSQQVLMTGILGSGSAGITTEIGMHDASNGLFFQNSAGTVNVVRRSNVTGSPVDEVVPQASWNLDPMDGTGPSRTNLDFSKTLIFVIDFEWLGVGRVRFGVDVGGTLIYVHEMLHSNVLDAVYMSTPNLPIRYSIANDGTGAAASMEQICSSVISEGGQEHTGTDRWVSTGGAHLAATTADTLYAAIGIRLKATHLGATVFPRHISVIAETNDDFEWILLVNPTVAGTFTYSDETNSCLQVAKGATANTVSGGTQISGGWGAASVAVSQPVNLALLIGSAIDGTPDELVLCVRPLANNANIQAGMAITEAQ